MKRNDLRSLASLRLKEAKVLLKARHWEGAYYLAGYAIELAFKAVIAKQTERHEFPDKARVLDSYSHSWSKLVDVAKLEGPLNEQRKSRLFDSYWQTVRNWSVDSRYLHPTDAEARQLVKAISDPSNGVLKWLKQHW
jgi:HEPN domain-containing protein